MQRALHVLSAVAEIERENIRAQTMEGRIQKAREGKWNGGFAPYGYQLTDGKLYINEEEAAAIRVISDQYVNTDIGANGVAKYLENHGIRKIQRQNGKNPLFDAHLVRIILKNPVYCGKIAYGRRKAEKVHGTRNKYHLVEQDNYILVERRQLMETLISEIQIYDDRQPNGQWLKSIKFKLPIIEEDMEMCLDDDKHVEMVVLLSKGEIDSKKIRVDFSLEDMDMSGFRKDATYQEIKDYVKEQTGLSVSSLYISQIKRKCGLEVGHNYNLSKKGNVKVPHVPSVTPCVTPEKEEAIRAALKYFKMIK